MKKTAKVAIIALLCVIIIGAAAYFIFGNPIVLINNQRLENSIHSIETETVNFNDVVPFEWDTLYTFTPYTNRSEIEKIIGFKSADIKENNISEGMVHLLFVKDDAIVSSILNHDNNLGYRIDFGSKIEFSESVQFDVTVRDGVTTLAIVK